jgi:hypothetical protein
LGGEIRAFETGEGISRSRWTRFAAAVQRVREGVTDLAAFIDEVLP